MSKDIRQETDWLRIIEDKTDWTPVESLKVSKPNAELKHSEEGDPNGTSNSEIPRGDRRFGS